jgi:hypothetical protein
MGEWMLVSHQTLRHHRLANSSLMAFTWSIFAFNSGSCSQRSNISRSAWFAAFLLRLLRHYAVVRHFSHCRSVGPFSNG